MTVDQLIRSLKAMPGNEQVYFVVPGLQESIESHWPVTDIDRCYDEYLGMTRTILIPYREMKKEKPA